MFSKKQAKALVTLFKHDSLKGVDYSFDISNEESGISCLISIPKTYSGVFGSPFVSSFRFIIDPKGKILKDQAFINGNPVPWLDPTDLAF